MTSTPLKTSDISIIIPTLNEESNIAGLAYSLRHHDGEIIIVDGGSTDNTTKLVSEISQFSIHQCGRGRGRQLNQGAKKATGKVLLFLHADTRLPRNFYQGILATLTQPQYAAGAFKLAIDNPTPAMRFVAWCANLRSAVWQMVYGDQAIFIKRDLFFQLGQFPETPIMEDYIFIKAAQKKGRIALLDQAVITSARRWQKLGVLRTTVINQLIILGFYLNIPAEKLASLYRR